jgi:SpoVK/Ycf46/Vps4 family AAA+-type ATPase
MTNKTPANRASTRRRLAATAAEPDAAPAPAASPADNDATASYDWSQAENELRDVLPTMFVGEAASAGLDEARAYDAEPAGLTLADVAGLTEVKQRLEAAFLAPMRNPELRKLYGKSLRGGLLLYGPPGWPASSAPGSSPCRSPT